MKFKKGDKVLVKHSRSGNWNGIVSKDFDTETDEWYSINLASEVVEGMNTVWTEGDRMPARRGLCQVFPVNENKEVIN